MLGWRWIRLGDSRQTLGSVVLALAGVCDRAKSCFRQRRLASEPRQRTSGSATSRSAGTSSAGCARPRATSQARCRPTPPARTSLTKLAAADPGNAELAARPLGQLGASSAACARRRATSPARSQAYTASQDIGASSRRPTPATPAGSATSRSAGTSSAGCARRRATSQARSQAYTAGQDIRAKLAAADPGNAGWQRDLSVSWNKLGGVREAQGDLPARCRPTPPARTSAPSSRRPTPATPAGSAT